jgi:hypothetical protein
MSEWMQKVLENKRTMRQRLVILPFTDKILERLRDRSRAIAASPLRPGFATVEFR